jgi:hypothetical protein
MSFNDPVMIGFLLLIGSLAFSLVALVSVMCWALIKAVRSVE